MNTRTVFAAVVAVGVIAAAGFGAWYALYSQPPAFCEISGRPMHSTMITRVKIDGKTLYTCCARCPLTLAAQEHKRVEILEVTDYASGQRLRADQAYFVDGSAVHMCSTPRMKFDEARTPYVRLFDRCEPSLLAFARRDQADEFAGQYGGTVKQLPELLRQATAARSESKEK